MIRQNTCPKCGMYIWAHRKLLTESNGVDTCPLSDVGAQHEYDAQVIANREYVARQV
jgi:hypothetical protein